MHLMAFWSSFTDTLNTRGGTIALLFVTCCALGAGLTFLMIKDVSNQAATVLLSTFSGFSGALLLALTQKDKPGTSTDNGGQK
jgi:FtsH-binding integral membrane protein